MNQAPPKSYASHWWGAGLRDGKHCEQKRRERYFHEYLEDARRILGELGLIPIQLSGPFEMLYRQAFRLGYDNAKLQRERDKLFLPRPRKRAKLGRQ